MICHVAQVAVGSGLGEGCTTMGGGGRIKPGKYDRKHQILIAGAELDELKAAYVDDGR